MNVAVDGKSFFSALGRHWVWTIVFIIALALFFSGLMGKIRTAIIAKVPAVGTLPQL